MLDKIICYFCYMSILTTSFDVFLTLNVGVNIRFSQIMLIVPFIYMILTIWNKKNLYMPLGIKFLCIWSFFIVAFIPNTNFVLRSINYAIWLYFNLYLILFMVNFFDTWDKLRSLLKIYLISFFVIALFGLYQFFAPMIGLESPLVTQWWIQGTIPRINGFSYEPSYFSAYLLIGWTINYFLLKNKSRLIKKRMLILFFSVETIALILSSSRMGWMMIILVCAEYPIRLFLKIFIEAMNKKISLKILKKTIVIVFLVTAVVGSVIKFVDVRDVEFLGAGLALFGSTTSHSRDIRLMEASDTIAVFLESPIIGYSLGGVAVAIAGHRGYGIDDLEDLKSNEGMSVFLEILAASGIMGIIPFILYFYILLKKIWIVIKSESYAYEILLPMTIALIVELVILQFNQNILRPYLWMHIAILSTIYNLFIKKRTDTVLIQNE